MDNQQGHLQQIAYALGAIIGDGSVRCYPRGEGKFRHGVHVWKMDPEPIERTAREINALFLTSYEPHTTINRYGTTMYVLSMGRRMIHDFLHDLIGDKLYLFPEAFSFDRSAKLDLLAGLFDTDGTVTYSEVRRPTWRVSFAAKAETLVKDVARLLQMVGVKVGAISRFANKGYQDTYTISPNIRSFIDAGCYFDIVRKQARLKAYLAAVSPSETNNSKPLTKG